MSANIRRKGKILSYRWKIAGIPENGRPALASAQHTPIFLNMNDLA
jgi:hypothetical protein